MKVLQFIPSLNKYDGGTATYMQQLAPVLGKQVELHLCALTPIDDFVTIEGCTPHSIPLSMLKWREMKRAWLALLEEIEPDVVHFNCCWMPQIAAVIHWTREAYDTKAADLHEGLTPRRLLKQHEGPSATKTKTSVAERKEVELLLTPHGMLEPWIIKRNYWTRKLPAIWLYQRRALKEVDLLVATAEEEREHLLQLGWNKNVAMVPNGIGVEEIVPKSAWSNRHRLLFMSRIHPKKGLELLFEAIVKLKGEGMEFDLQIAGDGDPDYVAQLKAKAPAGVSFLGAVYGDEKWQLMKETDVVVLPSYSENYGLIVAEALASATPVITTTGTPWSCIAKQHAGWWVPATAEGLTGALRAFAACGTEEMKTLGNNARTLALKECNIAQTVEQLLALYR